MDKYRKGFEAKIKPKMNHETGEYKVEPFREAQVALGRAEFVQREREQFFGDAYSEIEADEFNETKPPKLVQEPDEDMVSEDQIIAIKKLLDETKSNKARFLEWLKVENIDQILASNYERVIAAIEAKK